MNFFINLPMALTLSRIFLTPFILLCLIPGQLLWNAAATFLFIVASITDYYDGYYARKLNLITNAGKFLDPLADKILVSAVMIYLAKTGQLDPWMVILFVTRDTVVGGIRSIAAADNVVIAAKSTGKWKAALQMVGLPLVILGPLHNSLPTDRIGYAILWLSVILSLVSGYDYYRAYREGNREGKKAC